MTVSLAGFTVNDAITKYMAETMNMGQVMFVRGVFATLFIAALAWHQGALANLRLALHPMVLVRVVGEVVATVTFLIALAQLPIAIVSAVLQALPTLDEMLRDPNSENPEQQPEYANNELRSIKPEVSVLVGLCTHLGCSPEMVAQIAPQPFDAEWKGGYFCPCHKSKFDMAGRVYQGVPAPTNLVVPPHHYVDDTTIVIGVDPQGAA